MRYLLFFFAVLLASSPSIAQNMTIVEGESFKVDNYVSYAAPYEDGYIVLTTERPERHDGDIKHNSTLTGDRAANYLDPRKDIYISKLNSKLALPKMKKKGRKRELLKEINAKKINLYGLENINGKIYMYYTKYMKKSKNVSHCVMEINVENPSKSIETVLSKVKFKNKKPRTVFLKNRDVTAITFVSEPYGKKKDNAKINVSTFSTKDHSAIWSQSYDTKSMRKQIIYDQLHLAGNGTLFIGYKDYVKDIKTTAIKNKAGKKVAAYSQTIIALSENETQTIELGFGKAFPIKCDMKSDNTRLVVCGTYKNRHKGNISGVYSTIIDLATFTSSIAQKSEFGKELVEQLEHEDVAKTKAKDPGIITDNGLGTIINDENNNIKYIYEPFIIEIVRRNSGASTGISFGASSETIYYKAKSIIVADISEEDIEFTTIPRSVKFAFDFRAIQTKAVESDNQLYLLYLDHKENIKPKKGKKKKKKSKRVKLKELKKSQDGVLAAARLTTGETIDRSIVKDLNREDFYFNPSFMTKVSQNEYLLMGLSDGWFSSKKQKNILLKL